MQGYGCNLCRAGWNASAIRGPQALPRQSTGEFSGQAVSTAGHHLGPSRSHPRSDVGLHKLDRTVEFGFAKAVMDGPGSLLVRFGHPGGLRTTRTGTLSVRAQSVGRPARSCRERTAARGHPAVTPGKSLVAAPGGVARHRYPRLAGHCATGSATRRPALVSHRRAVAEASHRRQQATVTRARGCVERSVVASVWYRPR